MNFSLQSPPTPAAAPEGLPPRDLPAPERPPAQAQPSRPRRGRGRSAVPLLAGVVVLGAVGVVAANVPSVSSRFTGLFGKANADIIPYTVSKVKLPVTVKERGNLESSKNIDVANEVEGQTTIIKILPEGTRVVKDQVVCELDSATLRDTLTTQMITTKRAEADYENAKKTREVAEIAVQEYLEGTYPQEMRTIEGEITLAKSELSRALDRVKYSKDMAKLGYISASQLMADEQSKLKAEISEAQAKKKAEVLEKYTKPKQETELRAAVEKAKSDELAKLAAFKLETQKEEKLKKQIDKCILRAPNDGLIVYANEQNNFRGNNQPMIEEGAQVRERQKIFSLPDIGNMQVNTKIHETMVNLVKAGLPARVRVESNPEVLSGTVKSVAPLPDPAGWMSSDVKMYTTLVTINTEGQANMRPGMSAEVEILITQLDDVMAIPVQAVLDYKGKYHVFVRKGDEWSQTVVELGTTNDKLIEVTKGLTAGDVVAMNPTLLLSEEEKREAAASTAKIGKREWSKDAADGAAKAVADAPKGAGPGGQEKAQRKRGGGFNPALFQKLQNLSDEERQQMRDPNLGEAERKALLQKAGFTDEEMQQMQQMRQRMQQGGGPGGGGPGGGGPGGGFGGGRGPGGAGGGGAQ